MQSIFVFSDIVKFADFRWKNAKVSRTQEDTFFTLFSVHFFHTFSAKNASCIHLFFYKQFFFYPHPENCLSFSKQSPQKIV